MDALRSPLALSSSSQVHHAPPSEPLRCPSCPGTLFLPPRGRPSIPPTKYDAFNVMKPYSTFDSLLSNIGPQKLALNFIRLPSRLRNGPSGASRRPLWLFLLKYNVYDHKSPGHLSGYPPKNPPGGPWSVPRSLGGLGDLDVLKSYKTIEGLFYLSQNLKKQLRGSFI